MRPPPRPAVGRPAKYCEEVHQALVYAASLGAFRKIQAYNAGISERTLEEWLQDARDDPENSPYAELAHHLELAEAKRALEALATVGSRGRNWQADAWYLERKYPGQYGRLIREVTGKDGAPLIPTADADLEGKSTEELQRKAAEVAESLMRLSHAAPATGNGKA